MQTNVQPAASASPPSASALPDGFVKVEGGATEQVTETTSLMLASARLGAAHHGKGLTAQAMAQCRHRSALVSKS